MLLLSNSWLIISLSCSFLAYESPKWLLSKRKTENAVRAAEKLYRLSIILDPDLLVLKPPTESNWLKAMKQTFSNKAVLNLTLNIGFMTAIFVEFTGFPVILVYSASIYTKLKMARNLTVILTILLACFNFGSAVLAGYLILKVKLKRILIVSLIFMLLSQVGIAIFGMFSKEIFGYLSIGMTFVYMIAANLGALPITIMIPNEYVKVEDRGVVGSVNMLFAWGSAFIITLLFPYMEASMDSLAFLVFSGSIGLALIIVFTRFIDPEKMTFEEIYGTFKRRSVFL